MYLEDLSLGFVLPFFRCIFFDSYEIARYFPQDFRAHFEFGDVNYICPKPSITKSRPTARYATSPQCPKAQKSAQSLESSGGGEQGKSKAVADSADIRDSNIASVDSKLAQSTPPFANSTLLNLEKVRHFTFINDPYSFESKQDKLFYRGGIYQSHRTRFFEKYFDNALCDLGHTGNKSVHQAWQKPKIGIQKHLPYKFLLSLEGNDVASNLKWVMSSNSLAIMPRVKFETWFMEGELAPNVHYAEIAEDYEDVEAVLEHFIKHPNDAKEIIHNAHKYVKQFFDKERELIIALLVMEKYFYYTGQIETLRI